jgi:hypothetical protein
MILILSTFSASASLDKELLESKKCSNMFSYFEEIHNLPENTLHAISLQETQKAHSKHPVGIVWPWTITSKGKGYHFNTKDEAIAFAKEQIALGNNSIDVGCMQINMKYHPNAFASVEEALSPKHNIAYAAKLLKESFNRFQNWNKAIGSYHSMQEERSAMYQQRVARFSRTMVSYKDKLQKIANPNSKDLEEKQQSKLADAGKTKL